MGFRSFKLRTGWNLSKSAAFAPAGRIRRPSHTSGAVAEKSFRATKRVAFRLIVVKTVNVYLEAAISRRFCRAR